MNYILLKKCIKNLLKKRKDTLATQDLFVTVFKNNFLFSRTKKQKNIFNNKK